MINNDVIVKVEGVSKKYSLYNKQTDRLIEMFHPLRKKYANDHYALSNVSFEVNRGDCLGILGRNGAGKSTLLKLMTGVSHPSSGNIKINGRVSALLELGAGFNPLLTGRQNIFFQGALMGFTHSEMQSKIHEIIEFADIGQYINQPVKNYSSGMFARLAFAIATSVDPDILVVDEVLAVGDFNFRFKCNRRIEKFREEGKAIILVSHSNQDITQNCNKAMYLKNGELMFHSNDVERVIFEYEKNTRNLSRSSRAEDTNSLEGKSNWNTSANEETQEYRFGNHEAIISNITLSTQESGNEDELLFRSGDEVFMKMHVKSKVEAECVALGVDLRNDKGVVFWADNNILNNCPVHLKRGEMIVTYKFKLNLVPGEYFLCNGLAALKGDHRVEFDQRWKNKKITIISDRNMAGGYVYSPIEATIQNIEN